MKTSQACYDVSKTNREMRSKRDWFVASGLGNFVAGIIFVMAWIINTLALLTTLLAIGLNFKGITEISKD
jgi:uncharacterized membrane protein HdeD (DUF308 family)